MWEPCEKLVIITLICDDSCVNQCRIDEDCTTGLQRDEQVGASPYYTLNHWSWPESQLSSLNLQRFALLEVVISNSTVLLFGAATL